MNGANEEARLRGLRRVGEEGRGRRGNAEREPNRSEGDAWQTDRWPGKGLCTVCGVV